MSELTREQKLDILEKALAARKCGDYEEAARWSRMIPLSLHMAKVIKEALGKDFLINFGYDLSEVEATYGKNWLTQ